MIKSLIFSASVALLSLAAQNSRAGEVVNVYSYRQPDLVQPVFKAFTQKTGIQVNVAFLNKNLL